MVGRGLRKDGVTDMRQNIVEQNIPPIHVVSILEKDLTEERVEELFGGDHLNPASPYVALAASRSPNGKLSRLAIAVSPTHVVDLQLLGSLSHPQAKVTRPLLETVFGNADRRFLAFDMAGIALSLYSDHALALVHGIDLQDCLPDSANQRHDPRAVVKFMLDMAEIAFYPDLVEDCFVSSHTVDSPTEFQSIVLQAWLARYIGTLDQAADLIMQARTIDVSKVEDAHLQVLSTTMNDSRLTRKQERRPTASPNVRGTGRRGGVDVHSSQFKDRIRKGGSNVQRVQVQIKGPSGTFTVPGTVTQVSGKQSRVSVPDFDLSPESGFEVTSVLPVSAEEATPADAQKELAVLQTLQGKKFFDSPWSQNLYVAPEVQTWPDAYDDFKIVLPSRLQHDSLNDSQVKALSQMLSDDPKFRILLIQGPPGTGKTTVIGSFSKTILTHTTHKLWLVAQSNVAVKNLAEKLISMGIERWKLLVSKDFHYDWHEHLYEKARSNLIQTDRLRGSMKELKCSQIILCTLSVLAGPNLRSSGLMNHFPLQILVIDEASQIGTGDYFSILAKHSSALRKVCFIGDDKQLPPFGQENGRGPQSVFEIPALASASTFLDLQYRMPPAVGSFISTEVYDSKLQSFDKHPIADKHEACVFVDVPGRENPLETSFWNKLECRAAVYLAHTFEQNDQSYRIITPYEGQRGKIEQELRTAGLAWENRCFNVDSFQGNEDDFIILSLVRTRELGFLKDRRRTNVMLSRSKRGLYICSSKSFLKGKGANSLVGKMAAEWEDAEWRTFASLEEEHSRKENKVSTNDL